MGEIANLRAARAHREGDNTLWTPEDCAESFLADIRSGEIKPTRVVMLYEQDTADGCVRINSYRANVNRRDEGYMLAMASYQFMRGSIAGNDK